LVGFRSRKRKARSRKERRDRKKEEGRKGKHHFKKTLKRDGGRVFQKCLAGRELLL